MKIPGIPEYKIASYHELRGAFLIVFVVGVVIGALACEIVHVMF